jgi:hypothetical protein
VTVKKQQAARNLRESKRIAMEISMKKHAFSLLLIAFFLLSGCQSSATESVEKYTPAPATQSVSVTEEEPLLAVLHEVVGGVEVAERADVAFLPAAEGDILQEKGQVRTLEDGYTRIDLSNGTLIRMAPQSEFTLISSEAEEAHAKLDFGQIWIILNGGSLDVETPSGIAAVRGSYMMVEVDPNAEKMLVSCLEGHCSWQMGNEMIDIISGERIELSLPALGENLVLPDIEKMRERDFAEWLYFVPESQEIFPFLEKEGLLPWDNWREIIPNTEELLPDFDELFPEIDGEFLPDCAAENNCLPDINKLPDGSNLSSRSLPKR